MSTYIANAFVRVLPDTKGFARAVQSDLRVATEKTKIPIRIRPITTGFATEVRKQLRTQLARPIGIPVKPTLVAFRREFADELRRTPLPINLKPNMAPFLAELQRELAVAESRLKVTIPVHAAAARPAGGAPARGGVAAAAGRSRVSTEEAFLAKLADQRARATAQLNNVLQENLAISDRMRASGASLRIIERELAKVQEEIAVQRRSGNAEFVKVLRLRERELQSDLEGARSRRANLDAQKELAKEQDKSASSTDKLTTSTRKRSSAERALISISQSRRQAEKQLRQTLQQDISLNQKLTELSRVQTSVRKTLVTTDKAITAAAGQQNKIFRDRLERQRASLVATNQTISAERASLATTAAQTRVLSVNLEAVSNLARAKAIEADRTALISTLEKEETAARKAGNVAIAEEIAATRTLLVQREAEIASRIKSLRSIAAQEKQLALATRGAGATGLSLLGVRGATLAASGAFLAGAAAVTAFAKSIKGAAGLETQINVFGETAGATAEQMRIAAAEARRLGADITLPTVSAGDAAQAFSELAKAGLDVQDSIDGARGVLQLATAAQIENAEATTLVASALNAFGRDGIEATRVADLLTGAANEAQGSVSDMGIAMQQAAAVARLAGISLEDTVAFLTLLARNGLRGSDAGTSLRTALTRLINPTDKAKEQIEKLGIQIRGLDGAIRPDVFQQLTDAMSGMAQGQRDATLAIIFGQDALRAAAILGREGAAGLEAMREATQRSGLASQLAGARTKGFAGQVEGLRNTIETVGTSIGQSLVGPLGSLAASLNRSIAGLGQSQVTADILSNSLATLVSAIGGVGTALGELRAITAPALAPLLEAVSGITALAAGIGASFGAEILAATIAFKAFGSAIRAVQTAQVLAAGGTVESAGRFSRLGAAVIEAGVTFRKYIREILGAGTATQKMVAALDALKIAFAGLLTPTNVFLAAVVALAAAFVFFSTREGDVEKALRRFKETTDASTSALQGLIQANREAEGAAEAVSDAENALITAELNLTKSREALAASTQDQGTDEYRALLQGVRLATDEVSDAEKALSDARKASTTATDAQRQAERNLLRTRRAQVDEITRLGRELQGADEFLGGDAGTQRTFVSAIKARIAALREENTEESRLQAKRLQNVVQLTQQLGRIPTRRQIDIVLDPRNTVREAAERIARILRSQGDEAGQGFAQRFLRALGIIIPEVSSFLRGPFADAASRAAAASGEQASGVFADAFGRGLRNKGALLEQDVQETFRPLGISAQLALAEARGAGDAELLRLLRARLAKQKAFLARVERTPSLRNRPGFIEQAAGNVTGTQSEIDAILGRQAAAAKEQASKAKEQADKIIEARNEADQAILDAIAGREADLQLAAQRAALDTDLRNDLKAALKIRNFWRGVIKNKIETIRDMKTRAEALRNARSELASAVADVREAEEAIRAAAREQQDRIREALELNIEFFNIRGQVGREIAARRRLIRHLREMQKSVKEGSVEWRRLRNDIAREQKAIEELKKQTEDRNKEFKELAFAFLTTQQGFAATVMSNILGAPAVGGAVRGSGTAGPAGGRTGFPGDLSGRQRQFPGAEGFGGGLGEALIRQQLENRAGETAAGRAGPSPAQVQTQIQLLRTIAETLLAMWKGGKHKGSKTKQSQGATAMDTQ